MSDFDVIQNCVRILSNMKIPGALIQDIGIPVDKVISSLSKILQDAIERSKEAEKESQNQDKPEEEEGLSKEPSSEVIKDGEPEIIQIL